MEAIKRVTVLLGSFFAKIIRLFAKIGIGIVVFFGTLVLYHIIFSSFFQVDENNVLQAPDWYIFAGISISFIVAVLIVRKRKPKKSVKENVLSIAKYDLQKKIEDSKKKEKFDSLSESEKWRLEREARQKYKPQSHILVDSMTDDAAKVVFEYGQASASILQLKLRIGYVRASELIDRLEEIGVVGPFTGNRPREILISEDTYRKNAKVIDIDQETNYEDLHRAGIDINQILKEENEWRRLQQGLSKVDYELNTVDAMEGHEFEYWCAELLKKNGFSNVEVTVGSGDQGVDVIAQKDGIRYAIQCKCYSNDLGNKPIQEVNAGKKMPQYHCQIGVVMTNRYFTKGAKDLADATGVLLWDRSKLKQMLETANC